ncbi:MAG: sugar ABC transporter ATP-binding protein [Solirubrobacterales bacterium]
MSIGAATDLAVSDASEAGSGLRLEDVSKRFGENVVLDRVSLDLSPGEIHCLVGGNGSGKSTLIKILAGIHSADSGVLRLGGRSIDLTRFKAAEARGFGLAFVHQQQSTFAEMTVTDNLLMGHRFRTGPLWRVRKRQSREAAEELLERFHIDADPEAELRTLRPAAQTMVTIARALQNRQGVEASVLVLDEPTAALAPREVDLLLEALKRYAAAGQTVLFVSHRLEEILDVGDRISVLRDGRHVATVAGEGLSHDSLVEAIVGRPPEAYFPAAHHHVDSGEEPVLDAAVSGGIVEDARLSVAKGEIVGLTGLAGCGCSTTLRLIFGTQKLAAGTVRVGGEVVSGHGCAGPMRAGVGYIPPDRPTQGLFPDLSVADNLTAASVRDFWRKGRFSRRAERADVAERFSQFGIKAASPAVPITSLSGGNQQKVILARWVRRNPQLLLLDEPTQGVDVGARQQIWKTIQQCAEKGGAVLVASSDVEELAHICDRVLIMSRGSIVHSISEQPLDPSRLVELAHQVEA